MWERHKTLYNDTPHYKVGYYGETQDVCSDCLSKVKKFIEDLKCQEQ